MTRQAIKKIKLENSTEFGVNLCLLQSKTNLKSFFSKSPPIEVVTSHYNNSGCYTNETKWTKRGYTRFLIIQHKRVHQCRSAFAPIQSRVCINATAYLLIANVAMQSRVTLLKVAVCHRSMRQKSNAKSLFKQQFVPNTVILQ